MPALLIREAFDVSSQPAPRPAPRILTYYTSMAVFLLGAIALIVPSGYSLGAVMLVLGAVVIPWLKPRLDLSRADTAIISVLCGYSLVGIVWGWWGGEGLRDVDKPLRFLLAVPALMLVMAYPPRRAFLWSGLAMGAIGAGSWAAWLKLVEDVPRAAGHTHPIQFGNLSMLLGVLCLAGLAWSVMQRRRGLWVLLLSVGAMCGVVGSLLSGSRGGWVGVPFILLVLYRGYWSQLTSRFKLSALAMILVGAFLVYSVPQTGVQDRIYQAFDDVARYASGESRTSSVGARFEMWRGATRLFLEKPLVGWGESGYTDGMVRLAEGGVIDPMVASWGHAHNEFLDALAKRGVIGLLALLALYLVPMRLFAKNMAHTNLEDRSLAVAGVLLSVAYIDFGLSQVFMAHNNGVMMFAFLLIILWGMSRKGEPPGPLAPEDLNRGYDDA